MRNRALDLNTVQQSFMDLTLQDDNRTTVHLDIPTEALVAELEGMAPELDAIRKGDRKAVDIIYDLAARLISCNSDLLTVTAEELRGKYRMHLVSALSFFSAYFDFIKELGGEKN